jgi:hypothetical protein
MILVGFDEFMIALETVDLGHSFLQPFEDATADRFEQIATIEWKSEPSARCKIG